MAALRVLHVDDEPDIRELVEISLSLDPEMSVKSCSCGADAIAAAADWSPDLILIDVMMPVMDGPETLGHLRERDTTAGIPIVFMTARAQARELALFLSLGAAGVIPKPFDPITLATTVKRYLRNGVPRFEELKGRFIIRARNDASKLAIYRNPNAGDSQADYAQIGRIAHDLSGTGGIYNFDAIGSEASTLERLVEEAQKGFVKSHDVELAIDRLIETIDRDCGTSDHSQPNVLSA
jgi:CheY-like chemotaxis protein